MERNTYFEKMHQIGIEYEAKRTAMQARRKELIDAEDWDAVKALNEEEIMNHPLPFTRGERDAYRAYSQNLYHNNEHFFEVEDLPWEQDMRSFIGALQNAGIHTILVTDKSTALLNGLFALQEEGCGIMGLRICKRKEDSWHGPEDAEVRGVEVEIP